jgi:hypothetical protein
MKQKQHCCIEAHSESLCEVTEAEKKNEGFYFIKQFKHGYNKKEHVPSMGQGRRKKT